MLIIADSRMPLQAKQNLLQLGKVLWLEPQPNVYSSIAAHPDIYFCVINNTIVASRDIPNHWKNTLNKANVDVVFGENTLGKSYPSTAYFNATVVENTLIHHLQITDPVILNFASGFHQIHVGQGYTRCNVLALDEMHFITSDKGIEKTLIMHKKIVLYIDPKQITLPGKPIGFFGGACGIINQRVIVCGDARLLREYEALKGFVQKRGYELVCLYNGPVIDVGSILVI